MAGTGKTSSKFWEEDPGRVEVLKALWEAGDTCRQIGLKMGTSSGSVISKVRRIGLPFRARPGAPTSPARKRNGNRNGIPNLNAVARAQLQLKVALARVAAEAIEPPAHRQSLLLRDAQGRFHANERFSDTKHCHWPLPTRSTAGLIEYCGASVQKGLAYCTFHAGRMFQPVPVARPPLEPAADSVDKATPDFVPRVEEAA